ncbi:MAG: hypothetical protein IAE78_11160 [Myxococcus sp.]|nr:hypothetical protein [Myxococcus sp.]
MLKRPAVLLLLVFGVAGSVALVRLHLRRKALTESAAAVEPQAMAARFHRGAPPCLRYVAANDATPQAGFDETARRLDEAGLESDQLADVMGHFLTTHRDRELASHAADSVDEYLEVLEAQQRGPTAKLAFWVQRAMLREKLEKVLGSASETLRTYEAEGAVVWSALSAGQRAALDEVDATHPEHLEVSGLSRVLRPMKVLTTRRRARALAELAAEAKRVRPEFPVRLEDLKLAESRRRDGWGNDLVLSAGTDVIEVRSPGPEEAPGDEVVVRLDVLAPPDAGASELSCGPLSDRTLLLERVDLEPLGKGVHLVPAMVDGKPRGLKVLGLRPTSLAAQQGFCNGDVVRSVNGVALDSAQKALEVYRAAVEQRAASLEVERRGVVGVLKVELRD